MISVREMAVRDGHGGNKLVSLVDEKKEQRLGFIAEDVPDLVATSERDRLGPMDLITMRTKAVQEQQKTVAELAAEIHTLKQQHRGK